MNNNQLKCCNKEFSVLDCVGRNKERRQLKEEMMEYLVGPILQLPLGWRKLRDGGWAILWMIQCSFYRITCHLQTTIYNKLCRPCP